MGWDIVGLCAHVNLLIDVDTRNDEEDPRSASSAGEEASQAKYDCSFIFLRSKSFLLWIFLRLAFLKLWLEFETDDLDNFY